MTDRPAGPLRRFLHWYFGDPGRRAVVWTVWAVMTVLAGGYIWEYGPNLPVHDEWLFVPALFDTPAAQMRWVVERHGEHRYPLARAVFLALFHLSANDFRAGMWAVLALQAGAAAVFVRTASELRGRAAYSDCWFPVLLLHRGHSENLLMGYQVAFLLTVFAVAVFVRVAVLSGRRPLSRTAVLGAILLVPLALGGGIGLLFVPFLGGWLLWRLTVGRGGPLTPAIAAAVVGAVAVLGFAAWGMADAATAPTVHKPERSGEMMWTLFQTTGNAVGSCLTGPRSAVGVVLFAAGAAATGWLTWLAWRDRADRPRLLGCLAVVAGVTAFVAVIAATRQNIPSPRYTVVVALAPCAILLGFAGRFPRTRLWMALGAVAVAGGGGVIVRQNWVDAMGYGRAHGNADAAVRADVRAGMPADLIARRHRYYTDPRQAYYWDVLWRNDAGAIRGAASPATVRSLPVGGPPAREPSADPLLVRFRILDGPARFASALRVRYTAEANCPWQGVLFRWVEVDAGGVEHARESGNNPWIDAGDGELLAWVDGRVRAAWVDLANNTPLLKPVAVEVLVVGPDR